MPSSDKRKAHGNPRHSRKLAAIAGFLVSIWLLISANPAMAQAVAWSNVAIGSCDAPTFTTEITAGQTVLLVSGGLMAGTPLNYLITPYSETSRDPWWNISATAYVDPNGNVCVEVFATALDDFGTFMIEVYGLDASQHQYNRALGFTVHPPAAPTVEPTASATPTETPTSTPTPTPSEPPTLNPTVTPTSTPTDIPTLAPQPSPTPEPTEPPAPAPSEPAPTAPTEPPVQNQPPAATIPATVVPTTVVHSTAAANQTTRVSEPLSVRERFLESRLDTEGTWEVARPVVNRHSWPSLSDRAHQADDRERLTSAVPANSAELPAEAQTKAPTEDEPLSPASDLTPDGNHLVWLIALGLVAKLSTRVFGRVRR